MEAMAPVLLALVTESPVRPVALSVVTTLYRSERTISEFIRRASAAASQITKNFEIVVVDDGSPDRSLAIALDHVVAGEPVTVVELSRNFGHHKALMTGLDHARGELCFLIDSDLEEAPELLTEFHAELARDPELDVVYGFQKKRKGGWFERLSGAFAFRLFDLLVSYPVQRNFTTVRLMRRRYVDSLVRHKEQQSSIGGLWIITGFRQKGLAIDKATRNETTYSFLKRWHSFVDSVTSFSEAPLIGIFYLGLAILTFSALVAVWLLANKFLRNAMIDGWVSVMLSVWFLGGLLVFCVGIIGIYLSKVFIETKHRPYTIVRAIHTPSQNGAHHD